MCIYTLLIINQSRNSVSPRPDPEFTTWLTVTGIYRISMLTNFCFFQGTEQARLQMQKYVDSNHNEHITVCNDYI